MNLSILKACGSYINIRFQTLTFLYYFIKSSVQTTPMTPGHQIIFNYPSLSSASDSLGSTSINDSTGSAFHPQPAMQSNAIKHSTIKNLTPQFMMNEGCPESSHPTQTDFDSVSQISPRQKD